MQLVVDGLVIEYQLQGNGPVIVWLHGWGDSGKTFAGNVAAFSKHYQCLSLDLPGFGGSEVPHEPWTLQRYADFVKSVVVKLELTEVYAIVGHSNGGAIALKAIAGGLLTPQKIVLLASAGIRPKKALKTSLLTPLAKIGKLGLRLLPRAKQREIRSAVYKKLGSDYLVAPQLAETFKLVVREDLRSVLGTIMQPVLLVYGADDTDTPLWIGETFRRLLPNAQLEVISGAGHFVHVDAAEQCVEKMEHFLA